MGQFFAQINMQVYVARARYDMRLQELSTVGQLQDVQRDISGQIEAGYKAGKLSRQTLIREQLNSVVAEVRYDLALADLQNAFANVYASMGIDVVDGTVSSNDPVSELAAKLRQIWVKHESLLTGATP